MKVSSVAQGTGMPAGSEVGEGKSASPDRMARAKQVASGKEVSAPQVAPPDQAEQSAVKKIKMRTQRSVYRDTPVESQISDIPDTVEQVDAAIEDTKQVNPQLVAIAKAKRALQIEREAFLKEKEEAAKNLVSNQDSISLTNLKKTPLKILFENGVTYDQLTEEILSLSDDNNPAVQRLEAKIKSLEEGFETRSKEQVAREEAAEARVKLEIKADAEAIVAEQADEYEMVRETKSLDQVVELIDRTLKKTGKILSVEKALQLVEDQLVEDHLPIAKIKKLQSRLTPELPKQTAKQTNYQNNVRVMRTLTNKDGASVPSSARERAINAFYGRNK